MSIELSPTARDLIRSTFFGKDFDSYRQEIIDAIKSIFGDETATNIVASEQGVMLIELNAYALSTASWYGDRQADDTTLQYARLRFAAVTIARQLGYKATSSVPAVADVQVTLTTVPPVQLTIARGQKASGPDGLQFETLSDVVFDAGQIGSGLPTDMTVNQIVIDPATTSNIYVATTSGVLVTTTSGTTWSMSNSGITNTNITALAIDPVTPTILYAGTTTSGMYKSTTSGSTWTAINSGLSSLKILSIVVHPTTPTTIYVGTNGGGIFRSINSGATWSQINGGITDYVIQTIAVDPFTPTIIYAGSYSGGIFKTINGGISWSTANTGLGYTNVVSIALDPTTPTTLYAATIGGGIYRSVSSAASWTPVNSGFTGTTPTDIAVNPATPAVIYVSTVDSGPFKTVDYGVTWVSVTNNLSATETSAIAVDPTTTTTIYAGTVDSGMFVSINSATTWSALNNGIDDPIKMVQMREGKTLSETFRSSGEPFQVFELPVPTGFTIAQDSPSVTVGGILWPEVTLLDYEQTDQVEIEYGLSPPRVIFGDGIAGNIPPQDAEIKVTYFVTSGTLGSIASDTMTTFTGPIVAGTTTIGTVLYNANPSTAGSDPEPLDSIKINAPRIYQAAQRAVTSKDLSGWINSYVDPVYGAVSKGIATAPRSASADAEAQSIIGNLTTFGAPQNIIDRLSNYMDAILSSNCSANVINAQILASDSVGRYVPASEGLARNLATFLNSIAESTVEVVVTDGSVNLLSVSATIDIKITSTITNDALKSEIKDNVRTAVQTLLLGREFGDSLRIGDLYQTVEAIDGVEYSHVTLVVTDNVDVDVSASRLNGFGDLEIQEFEVITMGTTPEVAFI